MKIRQAGMGLFLLSALAAAPFVHAAEGSGARVETLLKTERSWDGALYKSYPPGQPELTMVRITIPPRSSLPWHTHASPNAAYVVSGEVTVETRDGKRQKRLRAGDTLAEMVGTQHRGVTGDQPVELLVFYAGAAGVPLSAKTE
ncbi:cupin domain-containing protein [Chromobacterium violaceum]|uniref:cupin domain-containing protein n=1 Tax=Chromobacterium violaceum TaxID=536 RepID=UPI0009DAC62B|nr:cupin domain-containing protein [Chromobacterium violaceum]MBP4049436.1 cupin domain-containing protein [Chromobacterium violaceum]OQS28869.1 cupin [Chromobacterium violaceum]OQS48941.1 cupin [Chromobacterium violaceum]OQS51466.1 cupin [Chromobacterium violaceum]QRO33760.1 cupin domain-containing protein [Chromobacterium violaceum]